MNATQVALTLHSYLDNQDVSLFDNHGNEKKTVHFLKETSIDRTSNKTVGLVIKQSSSFVVKFKLVTVLLLFLSTLLQPPPLASSLILGLNYARSESRVVI